MCIFLWVFLHFSGWLQSWSTLMRRKSLKPWKQILNGFAISLSKWIHVRWRAKQHRVLPSLSVLLQQGKSSAGFGKQLHPWEDPEPDFPGGICSRGGKTTESQNILVWKCPVGIISSTPGPAHPKNPLWMTRKGTEKGCIHRAQVFSCPLSSPYSLEPGSLVTFAAEFQEFQQFPKPGLWWQLSGKESVPCSLAQCLQLVIETGNKREDLKKTQNNKPQQKNHLLQDLWEYKLGAETFLSPPTRPKGQLCLNAKSEESHQQALQNLLSLNQKER